MARQKPHTLETETRTTKGFRLSKEQLAKKLPISNRYVFAKVMRDNPNLCREFVERILGVEILRVETFEVESEITSIEHKSVCIDAFVDSDTAAFTVEMQAYDEPALPLRIRYYRSLVDRRLLRKGANYADLKPIYIVFICTYDPFDLGLPMYTFVNACKEDPRAPFDDRAKNVVLNASGDLSEADGELAGLLQCVLAGNPRGSELAQRLQTAVDETYNDEKWVANVMTIEMDMENARRAATRAGHAEGVAAGFAEGKAQGIAEGCAEEHTREQKRLAKLMATVKDAHISSDEVFEAIENGTLDDLYKRCAIE